MNELVPYDHARILLAEAKSFDDVREILNRAEAMAIYYKRANDRTLEVDAIEIRMFAQRRYGQMLSAQKEQGLLSRGNAGKGRPPLGGADKLPPKPEPEQDVSPAPATLKDLGISKQFSARAQKLAALPPDQFEAKVATWRADAMVSDRVSTNLLEVGRADEQRQARQDLASALADTSHELTGMRSFPCLYVDPAYARKAGIGDRAYENHYPTEQWAGIIEIMKKAAPRLQPDGWAFIWIPRAHMLALHPVLYTIMTDDGAKHDVTIKTPLIWAIARALGCDDYSTCFVWTKTDEEHPDEHGTFLIARDQDEILCLYKKGSGLPKPKPEHVYGSNHRERSRPLGHSVKPPFYRKMIAGMVGCDREGRPLPVLELFARFDKDHPLPDNWEGWGNESQNSDVTGSPVADNPDDPAALSLQQGLDTSSNPGTAGASPQGEGSDAAAVANPEVISGAGPLGGASHIPPVTSETSCGGPGPRFEADAFNVDAEHLRWEGEGGRIQRDDDLLIVKPVGNGQSRAA